LTQQSAAESNSLSADPVYFCPILANPQPVALGVFYLLGVALLAARCVLALSLRIGPRRPRPQTLGESVVIQLPSPTTTPVRTITIASQRA
jgi:hypothetical protein